MQIGTNTTVRRARELIFSQLDDELLAIDEQNGLCYSLNSSAGLIWELLATPLTVGTLCNRLRARYAVGAEECLADVSEVLHELGGAGLVEWVDARPN